MRRASKTFRLWYIKRTTKGQHEGKSLFNRIITGALTFLKAILIVCYSISSMCPENTNWTRKACQKPQEPCREVIFLVPIARGSGARELGTYHVV